MCRTRCIRRPGWLGPAPLVVQTIMLCFDSCCSPTLITRVSSHAAFSPSSATHSPRPGLCVSAVVADPRCCRFADVCAACVLSERAIRVAPANILIVMALQLEINLPYAVIWNAADTVIKGSHPPALFVGRGRQGNVHLSCALLPRTWNNLGPRHGRALLNCHSLHIFIVVYRCWTTTTITLGNAKCSRISLYEKKAPFWPRDSQYCVICTPITVSIRTTEHLEITTMECNLAFSINI